MKRFISLAITITIGATILVSCGDKTSDAQGGDNGTVQDNDSKGLVTLGRWGGNEAETAAFNKVVENFEMETGIDVEVRIYSDYNTELQTELIGGTAPDVFYVDAYMAPFFIEQGILSPLDREMYDIDAFYPNLVDDFEKDGEIYAISKDYSTLALYYNKSFITEDELPASFEELYSEEFLMSVAENLPEKVIPLTYDPDLARNMFIAQNGGVSIFKDEIYSNISDEKIADNLQVIYDMAIAGNVSTAGDLGMGWNGDAFGNEQTAMMIEGNWVIGHLNTNFPEVDYGVVEVPMYNGEKGTMLFDVGYGINSNAKNEENASILLKYLTGAEGMTTWTEGAGVLPSRIDVTENRGLLNDPVQAAHIAGADYATTWQGTTTLDTINEQYRNYSPSVVNGERTLEEALQIAEDEANSIIEQN